MKTSFFTRTVPAFACLSAMLVVACGRSNNSGNASIKEIRQEEVITKALKETFPGYDPVEKENIALASRLRGATLEIVKKDEKTASTDAAVEVKLEILLAKPVTEIKVQGVLREDVSQNLEPQAERALPEGYLVAARCMKTTNCDRVLAIVMHDDAEADLAAGSMTSDETTLENVAANSNTDAAPAASPTPAPKLGSAKPSLVALFFAKQQNGTMALVWSASSKMGEFLKGGTRKTVAEAKAEMAIEGGVAPKNPEQAADDSAEGNDPLPTVAGSASDAGADTSVAAGTTSSAAPVSAGSASSALPVSAGSASAARPVAPLAPGVPAGSLTNTSSGSMTLSAGSASAARAN